MGLRNDFSRCPITGIEVVAANTTKAHYDYFIIYNDNRFYIDLEVLLFRNEGFWNKHKEDLKTLLYNNIWFREEELDSKGCLLEKDIIEFLEKNKVSKTPDQKADDLLEFLNSKVEFDGQEIHFNAAIFSGDYWRSLYFKNHEEFYFYFRTLDSLGFIESESTLDGPFSYQLTLDGLRKLIQIQEVKYSAQCFVAMSFDKDLRYIYDEAIEPAILESDFIPYIISNAHMDSDVTINDAILAGIKKSKFIIADFTQNKKGVYFEAGYALGRGIKVIYTCKDDKSDKEGLHFDTNHYQHILWKDPDDLKKQLKDKIEVFIKE